MGAGYLEALQAFAEGNPEFYERVQRAQKLDLRFSVDDGEQQASFWVPNDMVLYRTMNAFRLEPGTIDWIAGMGGDDVLLDIGANIGIYTIWAARTRGIRVFAFEPESQSYGVLCRNIVLNKLEGLVRAYCAGASDRDGLDTLYLTRFDAGFSHHQLGYEVDALLRPATLPHRQGCVSVCLDRAVASGDLPPPSHIKIDVDGFEHKVIAGLRLTLSHPSVRSVLVEINRDVSEAQMIIDELIHHGFTYSEEQVAATFREFSSGNYIFWRS